MRLNEHVTLVGSGAVGLSHRCDCHVYLLESEGELALVDGGLGLEPERILANFKRWGCDPHRLRYLFLTHAHSDHAGGAGAIAQATGCTIVGPEAEIALLAGGTDEELGLVETRRNGTYPQSYVYRHTSGTAAEDGALFRLGECQIRLIVVPGHSVAGGCYLVDWPGWRALFPGDVVFHGGFISLINVYGSDPAAYRKSLPRLEDLGIEGFFPGHGLWTLSSGQQHIDLALERMRQSVFPNVAIAWFPPMASRG